MSTFDFHGQLAIVTCHPAGDDTLFARVEPVERLDRDEQPGRSSRNALQRVHVIARRLGVAVEADEERPRRPRGRRADENASVGARFHHLQPQVVHQSGTLRCR